MSDTQRCLLRAIFGHGVRIRSREKRINKEKHGIDFVEVQALWYDAIWIDADAGYISGPRRVTVGQIGFKHWTGVYTLRGDVVRTISVRRARIDEGFVMSRINAEELDRKFDDGEDISEYVNWGKATRPNLERVSMTTELTRGAILQLDAKAKELGISRDALLEALIREKLDGSSVAAAE